MWGFTEVLTATAIAEDFLLLWLFLFVLILRGSMLLTETNEMGISIRAQ